MAVTPKRRKRAAVKSKDFWDMTPQERAADVARFDKPLPPGSTRPLSAAERARWEKARKGGHLSLSVRSDGYRALAVNLDNDLLHEVAAYAKKKRLTLEQVLERGLRRELAVTD